MATVVYPSYDPVPLVGADVLQRRYPELTRDVDPLTLSEIVVEATAVIEDRTSRRLAPFTGMVYQDMLWGIDPNEYGGSNDIPLDFLGSLGMSYANAMGSNDLVRHFWLDQFAPMYPELWTYNVTSMVLHLTYGNVMNLDPGPGLLMGPDATDGHCWLRMGTFAPEGTRITVTYDGGYTAGVPSSLKRACLYQAAKFLVLEAEPQMRASMNLDELDAQINMILAPWARA